MIRMAEARRVVDGDFFFLKLAGESSRGMLQAIEADRIAQPEGPEFRNGDWVQGVKVARDGSPRAYAIHDRTEYGSKEFLRTLAASNVLTHGFYDRFDQVRGISPIAAALNTFQDVYEGFDYALAKIKVAQLFGLVFYRDSVEPFDTTTATVDADNDGVADSGYAVDFKKGPQLLDLNPGDRAEFLESKSPPSEVVNFFQMMIHAALKSLDIPYSFFDESFTNFYGSRGGLQQYLKSCKAKIADVRDLLDDITRWRLGMAIADGELELPASVDFENLAWEWVPAGVPWWDPAKEVLGHTTAIAAGLDNPQRVCRESGTDFYENIDLISQANSYAAERGVTISLKGVSTAQARERTSTDTEDDGEDDAQ
jgi:capsid protein